jgi:hypothetical protein
MSLLNDPAAGPDLIQLALQLTRIAQSTNSTPAGTRQLHWIVYPAGGLCEAYYAYESNHGPRIYVVGFGLTANNAVFQPVVQGRLASVP